jgi:hypothetical protein
MGIIITGSLPYIVRVIGQQTKLILLKRMPIDAETQQLIWSVQSKADNPSGIEKSSKEYTEMLFAQFDKERKKQKIN